MVWDERPVILVRQVHREALILGVRTSQKNRSLANQVRFPSLHLPAARDDKNKTVSLGAPPHLGSWHLNLEQLSCLLIT